VSQEQIDDQDHAKDYHPPDHRCPYYRRVEDHMIQGEKIVKAAQDAGDDDWHIVVQHDKLAE
jgi:hypothetical protein